jgi:hypothetical protein
MQVINFIFRNKKTIRTAEKKEKNNKQEIRQKNNRIRLFTNVLYHSLSHIFLLSSDSILLAFHVT